MARGIKNILLIGYIWVTVLAIVFTFTKTYVPLAPVAFVHWAYGMMAPYQGDHPWNGQLSLQGYTREGVPVSLALEHYLPYSFAECTVRGYLRVYAPFGRDFQRRQFIRFGIQILEHARAQGVPVDVLMLSMHRWDRSPAGYEYLHTAEFTEVEPIAEVRLNP